MENKTIITFDLERDVYFGVLKLCVDRQQTLDEFVEMAMKDFLKKYKNKKLRPSLLKAIKQEMKKK